YAQEVAPENVPPCETALRREHQRARAHEKDRHRKARQAVPKRAGEPGKAADLKELQPIAGGVYDNNASAGREFYDVGRKLAPSSALHVSPSSLTEQISPMYIQAIGATRQSPSPKRLCTR